jgi:hypothetical protein
MTFPQFTIHLGAKVQRPGLTNLESPRFRSLASPQTVGEFGFYIRCMWRLELGDLVVASSGSEESEAVSAIESLIGKSLNGIRVVRPAWDLTLDFSGEWRLRAFADQSHTADPLMKNWHARVRGVRVYAGPGALLEVERGSGSTTV